MDDRELVLRIKNKDAAAFKDLVELYQDRVVNTCFGFLKNYEDAQDVAQEVFLSIYQSIDNFREEAKLSTWIYRISVTKSLENLRNRKRKKRFAKVKSMFGVDDNVIEYKDEKIPNPAEQLEASEQKRILDWALDKIPENQKVAITLHKFEGLSYKEVAEVMQTSLSSVESLIHRAKKNLEKKLTKYYRSSK